MKATASTTLALLLGLGAALPAAAQQQERQLFYPPPGVTGPSWGAPGYWWQGPNQFEQADPRALSALFAEQYRRGYERGRYEERMAGRQQQVPSVNWLVNPEYAASAQISPRLPDETAVLQVRETLQQARRALQQGDREQADRALARIDRMLGGGARQRLEQALDDAEQALQQDDIESARQALRQARQAIQQGQQDQQQGGG